MNMNNVFIDDNTKKDFDKAIFMSSNDFKNHIGNIYEPKINKRLIFSCKEEDIEYLLKLEELIYNTEPVFTLPDMMGIFRVLKTNWNVSDIEKSKYGYQIVCEDICKFSADELDGNLSYHFQMFLDECGLGDKIICDALCITPYFYVATDEGKKVSYKYVLTFLDDYELRFKFYDSLQEAKEAAKKYTNRLVKTNKSACIYEGDNNVRLLKVNESEDYE